MGRTEWNAEAGGWAPLPPGFGPDRPQAGIDSVEVDGTVRVVGLGAICDLAAVSDHGRTKSFSVSEFAQLDDGRRVILHQDRGFTASWKGLV